VGLRAHVRRQRGADAESGDDVGRRGHGWGLAQPSGAPREQTSRTPMHGTVPLHARKQSQHLDPDSYNAPQDVAHGIAVRVCGETE
jgi:hypothetical protein